MIGVFAEGSLTADLARAEAAGGIARLWMFRGSQEKPGNRSIFIDAMEVARLSTGRFIEVKLVPGKYELVIDRSKRDHEPQDGRCVTS